MTKSTESGAGELIVDTEGISSNEFISAMASDPTEEDMSRKRNTVVEIMDGAKLVGKDGKHSKWAEMVGKTVGFYFSAHWRPPCRVFTPDLCKTYNTIVADAGSTVEEIAEILSA